MVFNIKRGTDKIETKHRLPTPEEPLYLIDDFGNEDVKAMIHAHFGEEIHFPHRVRKPTEADYATQEERYKLKSAQFEGTAMFRLKGVPYIVGRHAQQVGKGERKLGAEKYVKGHLDVLFVASALQLYPHSHADVRLVVMHPADISADNMKAMAKALLGRHEVTTVDGQKISYKVTEIIPVEEPVANLQTFIFNTKGETYKELDFELKPGAQLLVLDIGGWLTSFLPCVITESGRIEVILDGAPVIEAGVQHIMETLQIELKSDFPELRSIQTLPQNLLIEAISTLHITLDGYEQPVSCKDAVDNAMQRIVDPVLSLYTNQFKRGVGYYAVILGGGGGGMSESYIRDYVLTKKRVSTSEKDKSKQRYGAIRGASKVLINFLAVQESQNGNR
jgi:hypothetical protein